MEWTLDPLVHLTCSGHILDTVLDISWTLFWTYPGHILDTVLDISWTPNLDMFGHKSYKIGHGPDASIRMLYSTSQPTAS